MTDWVTKFPCGELHSPCQHYKQNDSRRLTFLSQTANSSNFFQQLLEQGSFDVLRCYDTSHLRDFCDVAWLKCTPVNIAALCIYFKKMQLPLIVIAAVCVSEGRMRSNRGWWLKVFQFVAGPGLKVKLIKITNRSDELFRSRIILAASDEGGWTVHQSFARCREMCLGLDSRYVWDSWWRCLWCPYIKWAA